MTRSNALWAICLLFALYTVGSGLFPSAVPGGINGLALTAFLVVFTLIHGAARYGWRGILVFVIICLLVSNASENLSILTGFPFGRYTYTDVLGPKLFLVPVIIGGAYAGAGYLSWIVAHVLIDNVLVDNVLTNRGGTRDRFAVWALPAVGAVLMVSWDLSFDPIASTIGKSWIWIDGGPFFGVPLQNFAGWYLTVFLFLAPFSWYQSTRPVRESIGAFSGKVEAGFPQKMRPLENSNRAFWAQAILMYFLLGARYPLAYLCSTDHRQVTDPAGHVWNTSDIRATSALVATFTMLAFALIAWLRLHGRTRDGGGVS
jgi:putative membrane protein